MLRPSETTQKLLISSPARFIGEFVADDVVLTHSWKAGGRGGDERSPLYRSYFILSFITEPSEKAPGVFVPDYSPTGDVMCGLMALLFGKRFDHHGALEMAGSFHVPNLSAAEDICEHDRPYHGSRQRSDYPVELDLQELVRLKSLINAPPTNIKLAAAFQTATLFYARALRAVNRDAEVAYLHLITACERIAEIAPLEAVEFESPIRTALARIEAEMVGGERISRLFRGRMRQLKRRFSALITTHLDEEFFTRSEAEQPWDRLKAGDFPRAAGAAYDLRSRYVHTGAPFAHWIEPRFDNAERRSAPSGLADREWAKILGRAPTFVGLERLTRVVLLKCAEQLGAELPAPGGTQG